MVVPIWTAEECSNSDYGKKRLTGNMMCAGFLSGGKDACQGDSGGPMHYEGETGSLEVIGVVSWGRGMPCDIFTPIYEKKILVDSFKLIYSLFHRLRTTKFTGHLYTCGQLLTMDSKEIRYNMSVFAKKRYSKRFLRNNS